MKTYQGSCHCGAVRFEADIDLRQGSLRCNCSICVKIRFWPAIVAPASFRLLAGQAELTIYESVSGNDRHPFCRHCGVRAFGTGDSPRWGRFYAVNLTCLDNITDQELVDTPIRYVDGRNDDWHTPPAQTRYL